ncbi:Arm DNA-binding domain-containing protein [Pseudomonas sp. ML96]|uniref:Arm DNA-binding domain-containing protein n=1 Tax=Pseudomonas sp. ML96 TaxID=1523503 RepID=UPI0005BD64CD|nr:DUF3596 domain-containing protein [Pseudomonas sp. ML96]
MKLKMPTGVEIHNGKVRISFMLNGKRHREVLKDMPLSQKTVDYASKMRELVVDEIKHGMFEYERRFPGSANAHREVNTDPAPPSPIPLQATPESTPPGSTVEAVTVTEGVRLWLGVMQGETASTTFINYRSKASHVIRYFGDKPINQVTIQDLKLFKSHLVKPTDGKPGLSPKTVNDVLIVLRGTWADAAANGLIPHNHMLAIANHKVKHRSKADPFTREEIELMHHADPQRMPEARMVIFNCWTGLSRSELLGLAREDIDLENGLIHVKRACVEDEFRVPKEELRERSVELIAPAAELLHQIMKDTARCKPQEIEVTQRDNLTSEQEKVTLLFRNWKTGKPWTSNDLDKWFTEHLVKANVRHRGINQCRHTYASQALSSHVNMEWIAKQLGHADTTMIKKHYGRFIPKDAKRMAPRVSEQMGFGEGYNGL